MGAHRLVIGCNFEQYDTLGGSFTPNRYLLLDKVDEKRFEGSLQVATQPMQSGDTISDHMYRDPDTYSVSGVFSLNGINWNDNSYDFIKKGDRLTNIQEVFTRIKNDGILCTLITLDSDILYVNDGHGHKSFNTDRINNSFETVDTGFRFSKHKNMILKHITWTELENSVKYSFQFQEVIMVEAQQYEPLSEAERMEMGYPNVNNPVGTSLATVLADNGSLAETVTRTLYDNGYIEDDFLAACVEILRARQITVIAGAIISVATVVLIGTIYITSLIGVGAALTSSVAAIFPVGTIIAAAAVIVAAMVGAIVAIFNYHKEQEKRRKAFKLIKGSAEQDTLRLLNLLDDIELEINKIDSGVTIYEIKENKEQQVILNMAGEYYIIEFTQNNTSEYGWQAKVSLLDGSSPKTMNKEVWCPVSNLIEMNRNVNMWFKDNTKQYEVYLMNPALSDEYNPEKAAKVCVKNELSSYTIWVSKGNIQTNIDKIKASIEKAIQNQGFND